MSSIFAIATALVAAAVLDGMNGITRHAVRCAVLLIFVGAVGHALGNAAADSLAFAGMAAFMLADRRGEETSLTYMYRPSYINPAAASAAARSRLRLAGAVLAMATAATFTACEWFL